MTSINTAQFLEPARELGFHFWAGVPCSYLTPFINGIIDAEGLEYVSASNEGDAVAAAAGAALAGIRSVALMQNSGLGNAVSPLTSLNWVFRLPVLLIVTLRGDPQHADEPQHELMGKVTIDLLELMDIPWRWFPASPADIAATLAEACRHMDNSGKAFALVMRKGTVEPSGTGSSTPPAAEREPRADRPAGNGASPSRRELLEQLVEATSPDECAVFGSTGFNGRELYAVADRPNHLYIVGSMGCAASMGLGFSMFRPELNTVVCDGDGGVLMRMGNLPTVGTYGGSGFRHLVLDNGVHESTGGQSTVSRNVDFAALARDCAYASGETFRDWPHLQGFLRGRDGPSLLHVKTRRGVSPNLPRPDISPAQVRRRLMRHFDIDCPWRDLS